MKPWITGAVARTVEEKPMETTVAATIYEGAKRLVLLAEMIEAVVDRQEQCLEIRMGGTQDPLSAGVRCLVSRGKLLELLRGEEAHVGGTLARMCGSAYRT